MKKLLALCSIPLAALAFTVACDDGSNATDCANDDDCADLADTPVCDPELLICVASDEECAADLDCQIAYNAGDDASPACDADTPCAAEELCATGFNDEGFCVADAGDDPAPCEGLGGVSVEIDLVGGGTGNACLDPVADRSCGDDGACTVN